jgi:hypothetical protein
MIRNEPCDPIGKYDTRYQTRATSWAMAANNVRSVLWSYTRCVSYCSHESFDSPFDVTSFLDGDRYTRVSINHHPDIRSGVRATRDGYACSSCEACNIPETKEGDRRTPTEKYSVNAIVPKYPAVKGSLGVDSKCLA